MMAVTVGAAQPNHFSLSLLTRSFMKCTHWAPLMRKRHSTTTLSIKVYAMHGPPLGYSRSSS